MSSKKEKEVREDPSQLQREQQEAVNKALDETKDNIRKTISEARKELPDYAQKVTNLQEQTIETVKEIADNYIESQREIINSFQSAWSPYTHNFDIRNWSTTVFPFFPTRVSEVYTNMVSGYTENLVIATRLINNTIFANLEAFKTSLQQAKDNAKELSKIGVNTAKTFEYTSSRGSSGGTTATSFFH
jgi:hypothetical protein